MSDAEAQSAPVFPLLLVDDEMNILKSLRRLLAAEERYEVLLANSAAEALAILQKAPVAVVVSDQRMPEMTGVELLTQVKKKYPDTVRILLTGYADISASIDAINRGAIYRYLTKPWDEEQLLSTLHEASEQYFLLQENKRLNALVAKQNVELHEWNARLKQRVMEQTASIRKKNDELFSVNQALEQTYASTIQAFSTLSELQDPQASSHATIVAEIAVQMAQDLELTQEMQETLRTAGLLHDIGKIGIDRATLQKTPEDMNFDERQEYERHPVRGQAALDRVDALRPAGLLIRHHHERMDGLGFPDGLKGEDIPLGSRVLAIADAFQRLMTVPVANNGVELALMKLRTRLGDEFDPKLYSALEKAVVEVFRKPVSPTATVAAEINPRELQQGMIIDQDVISGTGLLLLKRGNRLTQVDVEAIQRHHTIDPFQGKFKVLIERS